MAATRPRDLLTSAVLGRLRGTDGAGEAVLAADIAILREAGYLSVALPPSLGGLGCTLRQAACGQRRLAGVAPEAALAVSAHLYWTGAAADAGRSGDASVRWILYEAARGALFGAGHGAPGKDGGPGRDAEPGQDLKLAAPDSRCEPSGDGGYQFRNSAVLASLTPGWDWLAVHAITDGAGVARHEAVLAFAPAGDAGFPGPTGTRGKPAYRVARVLPAGAPGDVFTTSAIGWGCAILASVEFSAARQAFRQAVGGYAAVPRQAAGGDRAGRPGLLDQWPVAEASLRLDALKERIAEVTHPWPRVPQPGPDLGGQHLISIYAMRREVSEGARRVRDLAAQITAARSASGSGSAIPAR